MYFQCANRHRMNKEEILQQLRQKHNGFFNMLRGLPGEKWNFRPGEKWTAARHLDHIHRSIAPLILAFSLPPFIVGLMMGKARGESISYDQLTARYKEKLAGGGKAGGRFIPAEAPAGNGEKAISQASQTLDMLIRKAAGWKEKDLDKYLLPHPLLGKLTVREMLYFTICHVQHHHMLVERDITGGAAYSG